MKMPSCSQLVTLALLVHDFGWVTLRPDVGIPAMVIGLILQTYLTISSFRAKDSDLYCHSSLLFWLIGNEIWTLAEYIWDDGYPVGFLSSIDFITSLSDRWYFVVMLAALSVQVATCVGLLAFYVRLWLRWRSQRRAAMPLSNSAEPLVASAGQNARVVGFTDVLSPAEAYVILPWLPLRMYYELFTLPWILMDTLWSYFDLIDIMQSQTSFLCLGFSAFFGLLAIVITIDCVRRLAMTRQRSEAAHALAEMFWVTGNVVWMLEDALTHWKWMRTTAVGLFAIGPFIVLSSMLLTDDVIDTSDEDARVPRAVEAGTADDVTPTGQYAVTSVPEVVKKKRHAGHGRKTNRLMKNVTVLPKGLQNQTPNFQQLVARLALNSLKHPDSAITLLNLGEVNKRLMEWKEFMPQVLPYYAVGNHADKRIVQVLCQSSCSFACATAEEVKLVLSLGASPDDVLFCEARKVRSHLSFVRGKGVSLMDFDDEAELRKIASEFPAARLLLKLAPPRNASSDSANLNVHFGAMRQEWSPLLALAKELGVQVVGVSLRTGFGCEGWPCLDSAFRDAAEAFSLAAEQGHSMEALDLGTVAASESIAFENVADAVQDGLSRHFPATMLTLLRVIASPGNYFTRCASMLLTQVVTKKSKPHAAVLEHGIASHGMGDNSDLCYVLNTGLYSGFASLLTNRTEPEPPLAVSQFTEDRPLVQCSFAGPSCDNLDIILKKATMPELEKGDWVIWPRVCAPRTSRSSSSEDADQDDIPHSHSQAQVWCYAEDGSLPTEWT